MLLITLRFMIVIKTDKREIKHPKKIPIKKAPPKMTDPKEIYEIFNQLFQFFFKLNK